MPSAAYSSRSTGGASRQPVADRAPRSPVARERLVALDVFRGMTIAGMLLVNDPGRFDAVYGPLEHAPWHGWTPTDLIFPFFLFIVGITTHLSLETRRGEADATLVRQVLRRGALIFVAGFLLNGFPFYTWGTLDGLTDPTLLQRVATGCSGGVSWVCCSESASGTWLPRS